MRQDDRPEFISDSLKADQNDWPGQDQTFWKGVVEFVDNKIVVDIFGEQYPLKTDADVAYVKQLAALVDAQMKRVAQSTKSLSGMCIGILAALQIADHYLKMKQDYEDLVALIDEKK